MVDTTRVSGSHFDCSEILGAFQIKPEFLMHIIGIWVDQAQFSWDIVSTIVREYVYTASVISKQQWNKVKTLCGAYTVEQKLDLKVFQLCWNAVLCTSPAAPWRSQIVSERTKGMLSAHFFTGTSTTTHFIYNWFFSVKHVIGLPMSLQSDSHSLHGSHHDLNNSHSFTWILT